MTNSLRPAVSITSLSAGAHPRPIALCIISYGPLGATKCRGLSSVGIMPRCGATPAMGSGAPRHFPMGSTPAARVMADDVPTDVTRFT